MQPCIAFVDPPYSRYFSDLAHALARKLDGRVVALTSSPSYQLYTRGEVTWTWQHTSRQGDREESVQDTFGRAQWARNDDVHFRRALAAATDWLTDHFHRLNVRICLVFSDARPFSVACAEAARRTGVECIYFERGAFRECTSTLSWAGLNGRFSLRSAMLEQPPSGACSTDLEHKRRKVEWLRLRFLLFLAHQKVDSARHPSRRLMQHKRYRAREYLSIAWHQWLGHRPKMGPRLPVGVPNGSGHVLLPLQLPTDSQFQLYSPFPDNQAFIEHVAAACRQLDGGSVHLLVKRHPMDTRDYRLPAGASWITDQLSHHFKHCRALVCINSNAGFEAACLGIPVVCFGRSFYTDFEGVLLTSPENTVTAMGMALSIPERRIELGLALRNAVLSYCQAPGDVWAYDQDDIERTAALILSRSRRLACANGPSLIDAT